MAHQNQLCRRGQSCRALAQSAQIKSEHTHAAGTDVQHVASAEPGVGAAVEVGVGLGREILDGAVGMLHPQRRPQTDVCRFSGVEISAATGSCAQRPQQQAFVVDGAAGPGLHQRQHVPA